MVGHDGKPTVTRFKLQEAYRVFKRERFTDPGGAARFFDVVQASHGGLNNAFFLLLKATVAGHSLSDLVTGFDFPRAMKFSSVRLVGAHVPEMMLRVLQYAGQRALIDREQTPF